MGSLKSILEKYQLEKWFQRDNLIVLVLAGILLVVIALPTEKKTEKEGAGPEETQEDTVSVETEETTGYMEDLQEYTEYLEKKLEDTLRQMKGVGEVSVMITLQASEKQIVEKEENLVRNNTTENDSQGGNRSIYEIDTVEQTVYSKTDHTQSPYVSQTILPEISGVLIVAQGAETATIKKSMVEIAQALFALDAHKISVVSMSEKTQR